MNEPKNFVKDLLLKKEVIDTNNLFYSYFYEDVEWFAYKISDNTMRYISYELTFHGIGYAFSITVSCSRFDYKVTPVFYSKSFTNETTGEWKDVSDKLKNKFICDAIRDLQIWN